MAFDSVKLIASQCIIHTLSLTIDNWKRGLEIDMDIPLLNHYIICNETEDVLRFGQVRFYICLHISSEYLSVKNRVQLCNWCIVFCAFCVIIRPCSPP